MTNNELNRGIKRLLNEVKKLDTSVNNGDEYFFKVANVIKPEFIRLYYADTNFSAMNINSIKIMIRLNLSFRFIPFHQFGINIDIEKL
jgi:hypothetical protein